MNPPESGRYYAPDYRYSSSNETPVNPLITFADGLTVSVYDDEIFQESGGRKGRVDIDGTIRYLSGLYRTMDRNRRLEFARRIAKYRGIHGERLEWDMESGILSEEELALRTLAHYYGIGREMVPYFGRGDPAARIPQTQAEGFLRRIIREGRRQNFVSGELPSGKTLHLLSDGTVFTVTDY